MPSSRLKSAEPPDLSPAERRLIRGLSTPHKIQKYLDDLPYNMERDGETCRSPRRVIRDHTAQCFEGALFAAAALRVNGHPPLILDLESVRDDDHVIAISHGEHVRPNVPRPAQRDDFQFCFDFVCHY